MNGRDFAQFSDRDQNGQEINLEHVPRINNLNQAIYPGPKFRKLSPADGHDQREQRHDLQGRRQNAGGKHQGTYGVFAGLEQSPYAIKDGRALFGAPVLRRDDRIKVRWEVKNERGQRERARSRETARFALEQAKPASGAMRRCAAWKGLHLLYKIANAAGNNRVHFLSGGNTFSRQLRPKRKGFKGG